MIFYVRKFRALWDAWEFCSEITKNKNLISKPIIVERKRRGNVKSIMVIMKLKKKKKS